MGMSELHRRAGSTEAAKGRSDLSWEPHFPGIGVHVCAEGQTQTWPKV